MDLSGEFSYGEHDGYVESVKEGRLILHGEMIEVKDSPLNGGNYDYDLVAMKGQAVGKKVTIIEEKR